MSSAAPTGEAIARRLPAPGTESLRRSRSRAPKLVGLHSAASGDSTREDPDESGGTACDICHMQNAGSCCPDGKCCADTHLADYRRKHSWRIRPACLVNTYGEERQTCSFWYGADPTIKRLGEAHEPH